MAGMSLKPGDEYTCGACREVFLTVRSDDEALAEMDDIFGTTDNPAVVCDSCWRKMMGLPPEDQEARA